MSDEVTTDLHYHKQPHTLDPNQPNLADAENDPPRAQGHTESDAEDVAQADADFTQAVKDEQGQDPVGPRKPGDHAGSDGGSDEDQSDSHGTVEEVKAWVGDDSDRARQALEAERAGQNRTTLVSYLEEKANA